MKLSIIVPVYNTAGYLEQCVNSLLAQTIPENDYEILLVNDGSIDNSLEVMQRFLADNPDVIEIIDTENGGQGRARNLALEVAQGDYIGFADSDDWAAEDMFARLLDAAERENADIAVCNSYSVSDSGQTIMNARPQGTDISAAGSVWNKIFRRSLIGDIRFPEGVCGMRIFPSLPSCCSPLEKRYFWRNRCTIIAHLIPLPCAIRML